MDQILDRINISGGQSAEGRSNFTNRSMINKFNLKLNDINKEIEYKESEKCRLYPPRYTIVSVVGLAISAPSIYPI